MYYGHPNKIPPIYYYVVCANGKHLNKLAINIVFLLAAAAP